MKATLSTFLAVSAADLMSRDLVLIPREMSLRGAARLLSQAHVSGAPVVDAQGRCIGVLSATDILHWVERGDCPDRAHAGSEPNICSDWQMFDPEALPTEAVARYMSTELVAAPPTARIADLARRMLDAHVHRVMVVDENERPIGIVTSTDVLTVVAQADTWNEGAAWHGTKVTACASDHG